MTHYSARMETPLPLWQLEIRTQNIQKSVAFYDNVFDWRVTLPHPSYAVCDTGRMPMLTIMQTANEDVPVGVAPYWLTPHCGHAATRAQVYGGRILLPRTESPPNGFWSHCVDPSGAEVAFWESSLGGRPTLVGSGRNDVFWLEIPSADAQQSAMFYHHVCYFDMRMNPENPDFVWYVDENEPVGLGVVGGERGEQMEGLTFYVHVDSVERTLQAVDAHGGSILVSDAVSSEGKPFAIVADPDGNRIGLQER